MHVYLMRHPLASVGSYEIFNRMQNSGAWQGYWAKGNLAIALSWQVVGLIRFDVIVLSRFLPP
jgi:hypothetical protein